MRLRLPPKLADAVPDGGIQDDHLDDDVLDDQASEEGALPLLEAPKAATPPPARVSAIITDVMKMRQTGAFILPTLLPRIKRPIDAYWGVPKTSASFGKKWPSCAVVGNSGTMIGRGYGPNIR